MFKVGDKVKYFPIYEDEDDGNEYVIESEYEDLQVFIIGNKDCFCDMVPASMLKLIEENNARK